MKIAKILIVILGVANALFFLFHCWLGWLLHRLQVPPEVRALLEMLNGGGALLILFLTVSALAFRQAVLTTALGRMVLALGAALYLLRGAAELVVAPRFSQAIFATCALTGALYVAVLVPALRAAAPKPGSAQ